MSEFHRQRVFSALAVVGDVSSADEPVQRGADEHNQRLCSLQVLLIKTLN